MHSVRFLYYRILSHITFGKTKKKYRDKYKSFRFGIIFSFNANDHSFTFKDLNGWESRNISTMKLLALALTRIRKQLKHSFEVPVITYDLAGEYPFKCLAYAKKDGQSNVTLIPDFFFDGWTTIGCNNYDLYMDEIVNNSHKAPIYDKCFWSGSLNIHPSRIHFFEMSKTDNRLKCLPINWKYEELTPGKKLSKDTVTELKDFNQYKYLIDLPCIGYSGRFKALLFFGRPVFKVLSSPDEQLKEYFYDDLKPFVHFIPVNNDLSDLKEKLDWAENHYEDALKIAKNAQQYAITHLRTENAISYLEQIIQRL